MNLPQKIYVALQERSNDEILGFMVIADKEETKQVQKSIATANRWASSYYGNAKEPIYIDNKPKTGFKMVTNVSRYRTSNVVWRIKHPDGFEFEITSSNMCDLLATNTIIDGEFQSELFFTPDRTLVSTKTKLFSQFLENSEKEQIKKDNIKALTVGDQIIFDDDSKTQTYVYCGKMHCICTPTNNKFGIPEKSTLTTILKNIRTENFYAVTNINTSFNVLPERVEITKEEIIKGFNNTVYNERHYIYGGPTIKKVLGIKEKPFKKSELKVEYTAVDSNTISRFDPETPYYIIHKDKPYRVLGFRQSDYYYGAKFQRPTNVNQIYAYPCIIEDNGFLSVDVDLVSESYSSKMSVQGLNEIIRCDIPSTIFEGKYKF